MKKLFFHVLFASIIMLLLSSCTEEQDFSQIDDLSVTPTLASGIFYLESDEETINSAGGFGTFYSQTINFDAFNETYVAERLLEGVIIYEIENTTSKRADIRIEFLDESGNPLYQEAFTVEANPSETFTREVTYGPGGLNLSILTNTSSLRVTGRNLGDATSVSSHPEPKISLSSAAEFIFRLK
ncbi:MULTISPECIES: hypothetical protein [Flagellimonas]|uniref:Uncharacterized protein n=1 Tax=Flagellimonas hadalis TaxID=2597517 RepID=A0A5N5IRE8_9FLAO|nr:hypothetical protein [Allomuricauda hadalis]KAB5485485.1 hypothetical protein FOT42_014980 [Allomuricauda hadalis]RUA18664.1 MAG: hypothetical protein DSY83_01755 [Flavobacteriia bacterium]